MGYQSKELILWAYQQNDTGAESKSNPNLSLVLGAQRYYELHRAKRAEADRARGLDTHALKDPEGRYVTVRRCSLTRKIRLEATAFDYQAVALAYCAAAERYAHESTQAIPLGSTGEAAIQTVIQTEVRDKASLESFVRRLAALLNPKNPAAALKALCRYRDEVFVGFSERCITLAQASNLALGSIAYLTEPVLEVGVSAQTLGGKRLRNWMRHTLACVQLNLAGGYEAWVYREVFSSGAPENQEQWGHMKAILGNDVFCYGMIGETIIGTSQKEKEICKVWRKAVQEYTVLPLLWFPLKGTPGFSALMDHCRPTPAIAAASQALGAQQAVLKACMPTWGFIGQDKRFRVGAALICALLKAGKTVTIACMSGKDRTGRMLYEVLCGLIRQDVLTGEIPEAWKQALLSHVMFTVPSLLATPGIFGCNLQGHALHDSLSQMNQSIDGRVKVSSRPFITLLTPSPRAASKNSVEMSVLRFS